MTSTDRKNLQTGIIKRDNPKELRKGKAILTGKKSVHFSFFFFFPTMSALGSEISALVMHGVCRGQVGAAWQ